jgi:PIN domain nuclease of toxin-antitoxin system
MRLLLDSHVVIALAGERVRAADRRLRAVIASQESLLFASVASLWEIAIKVRLRKLELEVPLTGLAGFLRDGGVTILPIEARHAEAEVSPQPETRDPFDRLLLAQCATEDLRLVTRDRALSRHPLAWRPD